MNLLYSFAAALVGVGHRLGTRFRGTERTRDSEHFQKHGKTYLRGGDGPALQLTQPES